ncbi:hypothetical protein OPV22_002601 [Ensete ventricosum]|uniref:Uncharacterized protein n=1 Tax=Ensete ventricosum TaxID=4639 RepID=A0AAV8RYF8_ENSVE|nr:hypothetical protein OPV22_002601 [Ensete ventricosum]
MVRSVVHRHSFPVVDFRYSKEEGIAMDEYSDRNFTYLLKKGGVGSEVLNMYLAGMLSHISHGDYLN